MALALGPLELAALLPGAVRFEEDNTTETWKAPIQTESGQTVAFLKMIQPNSLISEFACALIGRALGLNIPKPFLVRVTRKELPGSSDWKDTTDSSEWCRLTFALEDGGHPSLRKWFTHDWSKNNSALNAILLTWSAYRETALFDEWIANTDRNIGNILFNGTDDFVLIDHGRALTGEHWKAANLLDPAVAVQNILVTAKVGALSHLEKYQWRQAANSEAHRYKTIDFSCLADDCMMVEYAESTDADAACMFLQNRVENMITLISNKLGIGTIL
jgi:hypothetical protein